MLSKTLLSYSLWPDPSNYFQPGRRVTSCTYLGTIFLRSQMSCHLYLYETWVALNIRRSIYVFPRLVLCCVFNVFTFILVGLPCKIIGSTLSIVFESDILFPYHKLYIKWFVLKRCFLPSGILFIAIVTLIPLAHVYLLLFGALHKLWECWLQEPLAMCFLIRSPCGFYSGSCSRL